VEAGAEALLRGRASVSLMAQPAMGSAEPVVVQPEVPGADVTLVDTNTARAQLAQRLGVGFATPESTKGDCDVVFHASGTAAGLDAAIAHAGEEATVLELSWYGEQPIAASLGGSFHSRRLRLIASQVGKIATSHRPRWTHGQRLRAALNLLADARLDALLAGG